MTYTRHKPIRYNAKHYTTKAERDQFYADVYARHQRGETYASIARDLGLSYKRIQLIGSNYERHLLWHAPTRSSPQDPKPFTS